MLRRDGDEGEENSVLRKFIYEARYNVGLDVFYRFKDMKYDSNGIPILPCVFLSEGRD